MPTKPMLDGVELQQVQKVESEDQEALAEHGVPALEGDFLQDLGRRVTRLTLVGVMTGPEAGAGLKTLREKFRSAAPVPFVDDIATATKVDKVLIEELGVRELAGKPARFEYELTLREFLPPPKPEQEKPPPPPPPPPPPAVDTGTLIVEVVVEGQPNFDFSKVTVTAEKKKDDGSTQVQNLNTRKDNVWTEEPMTLGQFTVTATVTEPPEMSGSEPAKVQAGQTTRVKITLRPGAIIAKAFIVHFRFDKAFVEPCMREVLKQVVQHASDHPSEKLVIVGHTDKTGSAEYNQSLSERRARSVFAFLTSGLDGVGARAEWNELRKRAAPGVLPSLNDSWVAYEYQYILQDLGFYTGNIDGEHGSQTDAAVRDFQRSKGLTQNGVVDDAVWIALIDAYLAQDQDVMKVPDSQFLRNKKGACDGGILKWVGCGEEDPVKNTEDAWRPNRRVELLFVRTDSVPCDVPKPVTFNKPAPGAVSSSWCLGPDTGSRCCFIARGEGKPGKWLVQPAVTEQIIVSGSIEFDDGTPAGNMKYSLIAPDGEYMDGEVPRGANHGRPVLGKTKPNGTFEYPGRPKPVGIYVLEVIAPLAVRRAEDPPEAAKGNVVCMRLETAGITKGGETKKKLPAKVGKPAPAGPKVNPKIKPASTVVVVPKSYTTPARQAVTLSADPGFSGSGKFERSSAGIRFFTLASGGTEITFNGVDNVFTDVQLTAAGGFKVFAQGATASAKLNDIKLTLTLTVGPGPAGPPVAAGPAATATMTAVELTLDVFQTRTAPGVDGAPLPQPPSPAPAAGTAIDKWFASRPVHVRSGTRGKRALLIVRKPKPADFAGTLSLRQVAVTGVIVTGPDTKAQLFDTEAGGTAKANPHEFSAAAVPAGGQRFFAQGATVSGGLRDTGFQLGIKAVEDDGDRIALTVFSIDKVDAKLRSTPCKRDGTKADSMAAKTGTKDDKTFDATALSLVRECGDLKLTATVRPAAIPITWDVERAADDAGLAGLPSNIADPASAGDNKKRVVKADATGSFHIHAFFDVNGNSKRGADEDGIILNVNMVKVEVVAGAANNQIISRDTRFNNTRTTATTLVVHSSATFGIVPAVNAAYTDAIFTNFPLSVKVKVKLTGGGAQQLRGVNKIGLGYIQTTTSDSVRGTYADARTVKEVIAQNAAIADPIVSGTPAFVIFPVLDTGAKTPPSDKNTGPFINSSSDNAKTPIPAGGEERIVRYVEPPAIALPLTHPITGSALASISGSNNFAMFLSAFSSDFDENYTVLASGAWSLTYGTFTAGSGWTNVGAHVTAPAALTVNSPPVRGESTNVERCQPNFVDNIKLDAR